jgi:predicted nucleic acid-binding protein
MTIEAMDHYGWPSAGIARQLRRHWQQIQNLPGFRRAIDELRNSPIHVYPVDLDLVSIATAISQQFGLLSNDALEVAVMQHYGLTNLASNDADFDRVLWITRYAPT